MFAKYPKHEEHWETWGWRLLIGPAHILEGIFSILTFGRYGLCLVLKVAGKMAISRFPREK